jgi:hypothetical protein
MGGVIFFICIFLGEKRSEYNSIQPVVISALKKEVFMKKETYQATYACLLNIHTGKYLYLRTVISQLKIVPMQCTHLLKKFKKIQYEILVDWHVKFYLVHFLCRLVLMF